ncbi:hypothetical protein EDC01DRAFT_694430 [Geopyxis carbonaria]|nr:hypothetical protein EDC01DRAFT_694430 [Geopyxis carbonaria]
MFASQAPPPIHLAHLNLPPIYILPTRLSKEKIEDYRCKLLLCECTLADIATDAAFFLGDIKTARRGELELKQKDVIVVREGSKPPPDTSLTKIRLVNIKWLTDSLEKGEALNPDNYIILSSLAYYIIVRPKPAGIRSVPTETPNQKRSREILERAIEDGKKLQVQVSPVKRRRLKTGSETGMDKIISITKLPDRPRLKRSTTSFEARPRDDLPDWITQKNNYSCCRSTPPTSPNKLFIDQLVQIYRSRFIAQDEVGALAYSSSISAIKAYPYPVDTATELENVPGCDGKMADLYRQFKESSEDPEKRFIPSVRELENTEPFQVLKDLTAIHGIGPETARSFFLDHGVKSLRDLRKHHWESLSRVQQIGLRCYDDFLQPIPRSEIEEIAATVKTHAETLCGGIECMIAGGYRRGKEDSHDADLLLSHRNPHAIGPEFLKRLITKLEEHELVKYTLSVAIGGKTAQPVPDIPIKDTMDKLDKILLVWKGKSPCFRRVDIIVVPTISVGSALLGWTGGTVFERDLRLFCEKERQWKFNNEGVWNGKTRVLGTYGWEAGESWDDTERRVMETIGIGWRPPNERCTG